MRIHQFLAIPVRFVQFALLTAALTTITACYGNEPVASPTPAGPSPVAQREPTAVVMVTSAYPAPTAIPTDYPAFPTAGPTATLDPLLAPFPTPDPNVTPPTPVPTRPPLFREQLTPEQIADMNVWRSVEDNADFQLIQISETPLGVVDARWSPAGTHLVLEIATSEIDFLDVFTTPVIVPRNSDSAWGTKSLGRSRCAHFYEWSPDGTELAFIRDGQLQVMDADGNPLEAYPVPPEAWLVTAPRYSPDGNTIALLEGHFEDDQSNREVYNIWGYDRASGSSSLLVEDAGLGAFAWSPDGDAIAALGLLTEPDSSGNFPAMLSLSFLDGTPAERVQLASVSGLSFCSQAPQWQGDGQQFVVEVAQPSGVWLVDRNAEAQPLEAPQEDSNPPIPISSGRDIANPSPDGRFILFDPNMTGPYLFDQESGDLRAVPRVHLSMTVWSPAGSHYLNWYFPATDAPSPLELVDATDGGVTQLDEEGIFPAWSPDGQSIAYWKHDDEIVSLWLRPLAGQPRELASFPSGGFVQIGAGQRTDYNMTPRWSPDGAAIAFVAWDEAQPEAFLIELK